MRGRALTTIYNVLELCSLFALAGMASSVQDVQLAYLRGREVEVFFPRIKSDWGQYVESILSYIGKGLSYGDAVVAEAVEQSDADVFVTWNKRYF